MPYRGSGRIVSTRTFPRTRHMLHRSLRRRSVRGRSYLTLSETPGLPTASCATRSSSVCAKTSRHGRWNARARRH